MSENNMRKFEPYQIGEEDTMRELLAHKELKKGFLGSLPLKSDFFHEKMTRFHHKNNPLMPRNEELFLQISRDTMREVLTFAENYN
jgi:truncated hemoglobin YjbI